MCVRERESRERERRGQCLLVCKGECLCVSTRGRVCMGVCVHVCVCACGCG